MPLSAGSLSASHSAMRVQRVGYLASPARDLGPGTAVDVAFDPARDDLGVAVVEFGEGNQVGDEQGLVLHQALEHGFPFVKVRGRAAGRTAVIRR
jgi:hypothetical protein